MPKVGDSLILSLILEDGVTNKFPRAYAYDASGSAISGSPVDLAHVANGLYRDTSLLMPNTQAVSCVFKVFSDSGHTTLDASYSQELDTFFREDPSLTIGTVVSGSLDLMGTVEELDDLEGQLQTNDDVAGVIQEC